MTQSLTTPPAQTLQNLDPAAKQRAALVQLAREVACEFEDLAVVLARNGLNDEQYAKILNNPFYSRVLTATKSEWADPHNTEMRVRMTSAWLLEKALPDVYIRIINPQEPLSSVNEGIKTLAKLAGIGEKGPDHGTGEKFLISINLGSDKTITQEVKTIETKAVDVEGPTTLEGTPRDVIAQD